MQPIPISYEQMRSLVLEALRAPDMNQVNSMFQQIAALAKKYEYITIVPLTGDGRAYLDPKDKARIRSILWNLIAEGIIRPGVGDAGEWPTFEVTEHGVEVLKGDMPSPYDPHGYLVAVKKIAGIDPVIVTYLTESLRTFRINCYLAATVTLGCASEKAMLDLLDQCIISLGSGPGEQFRKKIDKVQTKGKFDEFAKIFQNHILPMNPGREIVDALEIQLKGVFEIVRLRRNAAGHPTGEPVTQQDANASLFVFPAFLKKVYELIDWLKVNSI